MTQGFSSVGLVGVKSQLKYGHQEITSPLWSILILALSRMCVDILSLQHRNCGQCSDQAADLGIGIGIKRGVLICLSNQRSPSTRMNQNLIYWPGELVYFSLIKRA